jgi:hypothetical protein
MPEPESVIDRRHLRKHFPPGRPVRHLTVKPDAQRVARCIGHETHIIACIFLDVLEFPTELSLLTERESVICRQHRFTRPTEFSDGSFLELAPPRHFGEWNINEPQQIRHIIERCTSHVVLLFNTRGRNRTCNLSA